MPLITDVWDDTVVWREKNQPGFLETCIELSATIMQMIEEARYLMTRLFSRIA